MNFAWGKAIIDFFIGCMILTAFVVPVLDVIATIFFFLATIILIIISIVYRKDEALRVEAELKVLQVYKA
jgi:uncharacterized membrane protein